MIDFQWFNLISGGVITCNICKEIDWQDLSEVSKMVVSSLNLNNEEQFHVINHNPFDD